MFKIFKNDTKSQKTEQKSSNSTTVTSTKNGNSVMASVTQNKTNYTTVSHSSTTQKLVQSRPLCASDDLSLMRRINENACSDTITYKGAPPRSAFTSTPLTIKSSSFGSKSSVDAKPFRVTQPPLPAVPSKLKPIVQSNVLNNGEPSSTFANELRVKLQIKVKKSAKFYDDQNSVVPIYKTRCKNRGKLLLINNITFINGKEIRKGAELDESNAYELFKQMGFEIVRYRNLNKKEVMAKVTAFRKDKTLNKVDIGAVIVMSHGTGRERSDSTEIACTDGELLPATWIINEFDSTQCPQLDRKPKIFIFQCCRGDQWDIQHDGLPTPVSRKLCDMLIAYATVPGFVAHRDPVHGTWYIQAICKVFMEHAHNTDVECLLKIVDNKLSSLVTDHGSKQTTSFENRGFKTCYLHPQLCEK